MRTTEIEERHSKVIDDMYDLMNDMSVPEEYKNKWKDIAVELISITLVQEDEFSNAVDVASAIDARHNNNINDRIQVATARIKEIWEIPGIDGEYCEKWRNVMLELTDIAIDKEDEYNKILQENGNGVSFP